MAQENVKTPFLSEWIFNIFLTIISCLIEFAVMRLNERKKYFFSGLWVNFLDLSMSSNTSAVMTGA